MSHVLGDRWCCVTSVQRLGAALLFEGGSVSVVSDSFLREVSRGSHPAESYGVGRVQSDSAVLSQPDTSSPSAPSCHLCFICSWN